MACTCAALPVVLEGAHADGDGDRGVIVDHVLDVVVVDVVAEDVVDDVGADVVRLVAAVRTQSLQTATISSKKILCFKNFLKPFLRILS